MSGRHAADEARERDMEKLNQAFFQFVSTNKVDDALRLVEKGANVHFVNKDEPNSCLALAAEKGYVDMVCKLCDEANAHVHSQGGRAFECAVKQNHERVVKALMERGNMCEYVCRALLALVREKRQQPDLRMVKTLLTYSHEAVFMLCKQIKNLQFNALEKIPSSSKGPKATKKEAFIKFFDEEMLKPFRDGDKTKLTTAAEEMMESAEAELSKTREELKEDSTPAFSLDTAAEAQTFRPLLVMKSKTYGRCQPQLEALIKWLRRQRKVDASEIGRFVSEILTIYHQHSQAYEEMSTPDPRKQQFKMLLGNCLYSLEKFVLFSQNCLYDLLGPSTKARP